MASGAGGEGSRAGGEGWDGPRMRVVSCPARAAAAEPSVVCGPPPRAHAMLTPKQLLVLLDRGVLLDAETAVPRPPTARRLFGAPDPGEAARFAEEHLRADRERFARRFGLDMLAPSVLPEVEEAGAAAEERGKAMDRRPLGGRAQLRRCPYSRQLLLTDVWRARRRPASPRDLKASVHRGGDSPVDAAPSQTLAPTTTS